MPFLVLNVGEASHRKNVDSRLLKEPKIYDTVQQGINEKITAIKIDKGKDDDV